MTKIKLKIPNHVGIILDGNGRWAQEKGLKRTRGHLAGYKNLLKISKYILESGTNYLSVFAFSTENFKRPIEEVNYIMDLFIQGFKKDSKYFIQNDIKVIFSGKQENLKQEVLLAMKDMEEKTKNNTHGTLNICLNYGGRSEIIDAVNKIIESGESNITEETFSNYFYQNLPDIDFMIRTSGEKRISNFMLWQISYAELYFPKCYFPDFNKKEYDKALIEYTSRDRRFGGINKNE